MLRRGAELRPIGLARWRKESIYAGTACRVTGCADQPIIKGCCYSHYYAIYKYGVEPEEFARLLTHQGGGCAVCQRTLGGSAGKPGRYSRLAVDHNHRTGDVRGLLCMDCNLGIGKFDDDPQRLERAAAYLRRRIRKVA